MTTKKQLVANKKNAIFSTGPNTYEGKSIVSKNAIKYGIFSKDLIIDKGMGKEDENEYLELLHNLIDSLNPTNQIEALLVEKISLDFWRLRRVIRFESGSIRKYLEEIISNFYSYGRKNNNEVNEKIQRNKQTIEWNNQYLEYLKKGIVSFEFSIWEIDDFKSDIMEDFYMIAEYINYSNITKNERDKLYEEAFNFNEIKKILQSKGVSSNKEISSRLIEIYTKQNKKLLDDIIELEQTKVSNIDNDLLNIRISAIPENEDIDKIMKYEIALQRSIYRNLILLKKMQGYL